MAKPQLEMADIFRQYGEGYRARHGATMSPEQFKAMRAIENCRTAVLGGHVEECDHCAHQVISYNSCRNRHCPKCQGLAKARWLEERRAEVLPVEYHHVIFTLPCDLAPLALQNKRVVYGLLFRAASRTLLTIAADPKHLGARIGLMAILHTWGQTMTDHPHVHCVVPGGGLAPSKKSGEPESADEWRPCRKGFLFPVKVLSRLYRRLFLEALDDAFNKGQLQFHGQILKLSQTESFERLLKKCGKIEWVVFSKPPFGGARNVLDYLARYTHRVAISNHRLVAMKDGRVTFKWRDYRHGGREKMMTLDVDEFIRRFLQHVLPTGLVRIRYYGLFANRHRALNLVRCRAALGVDTDAVGENDETGEPDWAELVETLMGLNLRECPSCKQGKLRRRETLLPDRPISLIYSRAPPFRHGRRV